MASLSEPRRPRLLPQNRKLRHLQGVSLRNLSFTPSRLETADDAGVVSAPAKLEVLRESSQLQASLSSDNLAAQAEAAPRPSRPMQRQRKQSLSLAQASPTSRQKKLDAYLDGVIGDVFFSLHVPGEAQPVYISEVRERSANFNFQFFELASQPSAVARSCALAIRFWARRPRSDAWVFLLDEAIDMRRLNFIGTLRDRSFPPNAVVLHLEDGVYSLDFANRIAEPKQAAPTPTSSYKALMKLANLQSSIEDAEETQESVKRQINAILEEDASEPPSAEEEEASIVRRYAAAQERANELAKKKLAELRDSIQSRRTAISTGRDLQKETRESMAKEEEALAETRALLDKTALEIRGQRRRICSDLCDIFPITPVPGAPPLCFQIRGIPLSNSVYDAATQRSISEDALSAGLGMVALLAQRLQLYLAHPLPYPLDPCGSRSSATDTISQLPEKQNQRRDFPLFLPRGGSTAGQWRFEYAWFLLNKDIEALCSSQGLKVVDIRHTLPNLKYLLYVASAGSDEMPERMKGGVRGLWQGSLQCRRTPHPGDGRASVDSGRGSIGSTVEADRQESVFRGGGGGARGGGTRRREATQDPDEAVPLPLDTSFTLRTKGMREHRS